MAAEHIPKPTVFHGLLRQAYVFPEICTGPLSNESSGRFLSLSDVLMVIYSGSPLYDDITFCESQAASRLPSIRNSYREPPMCQLVQQRAVNRLVLHLAPHLLPPSQPPCNRRRPATPQTAVPRITKLASSKSQRLQRRRLTNIKPAPNSSMLRLAGSGTIVSVKLS